MTDRWQELHEMTHEGLADYALRLERVAGAAGPLARLPWPVSADERDEWRVHQQRLRAALAALDQEAT